MLRLPDQIHLVRMARPMLHEYAEACGDRLTIRQSVVDVDTLPRGPDADLSGWPDMELATTGYEWKAWTWRGWSLVLMWKEDFN